MGLEVVKFNCDCLVDLNLGGNQIEEEGEVGDGDVFDGYCIIIFNYVQVYKIRMKFRNVYFFFNVGMEWFIRDWKIVEVMIFVRDS